jgi:hypothetical protein
MPLVRSGMRRFFLVLAASLALWITWDLNHSTPHSLRTFDPHQVGRLETAMWRSYYEHRRLAMFGQLVDLMRTQYQLPFWSSTAAGYHAAKAAVVFQRGHNRAEHELALPDLISYYGIIRRFSDTPFDVTKTARLELEWWIIHRQRATHTSADLETALAALQAEIYHEPAEGFAEHARARAQAMQIRDASAEQGKTREAEWWEIGKLLDQSWTTLKQVIAEQQTSRL